jgi:DNA-binding IclR family transcriptional regulator
MVKPPAKPSTTIQSVSRASRLLLFVAENHEGATAKEAAVALGLALPTTYHLLNTLVAEGLLAKDSRRRYSVGPKVGALSDAYLRDASVPEWLLLPLHQLAETTGETAYLAAWRRHEIRVLATVEGAHAVRVAGLHAGYYANGHARATGKLLLALARDEVREAYLQANPMTALTPRTITSRAELEHELERIRERGYAYDEEEFSEGVGCVAAAAIENDVVIAAYTVSAPAERFRERRRVLTEATVFTARSAAARARQAHDGAAAAELAG